MKRALAMEYISHPLIVENTVEARVYQQVVYAKAVESNTLFVAPTALGKTVLCIMVAAHRLHTVGGRVMMLAPTRPLVLQHAESFRKFMKLPEDEIADVSGRVRPREREEIWPSVRIAVTTPQVVENDLRSGRIDLSPYSLMVFDEAHRAVGNYAYVPIAEAYAESDGDHLVLGLTASPGNREEVIREVCANLNISNIEVRTDEDPDVKRYINPVEIDWEMVSLPEAIRNVSRRIKAYLEERFDNLRRMGLINSERPTKRDLLDAGKILRIGEKGFTASFGKPEYLYYKSLMDYATGLKAEHALELLQTQGVEQTLQYMDNLSKEAKLKKTSRSTKSFVHNNLVQNFLSSLHRLKELDVEHPKVAKTERAVRHELDHDPESRIIVFTNYRNTVDLLVDRLSALDRARVTRFVGQSSRRSKGLSQKEQGEILDLFRKGHYNVLVATSVAEEGLDIPEVQMVLFYDCTPSAIRNIQRRGRTGRKGAGRVIVLITQDTREEAYHWAGQARERKMKRVLKKVEYKLSDKQLSLDGFVDTS